MSWPNRKNVARCHLAHDRHTDRLEKPATRVATAVHGSDEARFLLNALLALGLAAGCSAAAQAEGTDANSRLAGDPAMKSAISQSADALPQSDDNDLDSLDVPEVSAPVLPAFVPIAVLAGLSDPNGKVPVFNAVAGSGVPNLAVADPQVLLTHGKTYCYTVVLQDYKVAGSAKVDYYIQQVSGGKTVTIQTGTPTAPFTSADGDVWGYSFCSVLPDLPGVATLVGRVRWGSGFTDKALVKSTILIQ